MWFTDDIISRAPLQFCIKVVTLHTWLEAVTSYLQDKEKPVTLTCTIEIRLKNVTLRVSYCIDAG